VRLPGMPVLAMPARLASAVAVLLLAAGWLLAGAPTALAHALVVGTNPEAGVRVGRAPAELRVAFSEAVRPLGPGLTLRGPTGTVRLGPVGHPAGRSGVLAAALPRLADGAYVAGWRIVSVDDGHVEAGSFGFAIGAGSGPLPSPARPQLPTPWQVVGRWLEAAGVLLLVGVVAAALVVWPPVAVQGSEQAGLVRPEEPLYGRFAVVGAAIGVVGLVWEVAAGAATAGRLGPGAVDAFLAAAPATARRVGVELGLLAVAVALVWGRAQRRRRPGVAALVVVVALTVGLALGSHATGLAPRWLYVALETVHLLAVGAWIGGLAVVALTVVQRRATAAPCC
jgi:copper transport protein